METDTADTIPAPAPRTAHGIGTRLRLAYVDRFGFCGREHHPEPHDVGFEGEVVSSTVAVHNLHNELLDVLVDAPAGTELALENDYACYTVLGPDGRVLEMIDHEVEVMAPPPEAVPGCGFWLDRRELTGHALVA